MCSDQRFGDETRTRTLRQEGRGQDTTVVDSRRGLDADKHARGYGAGYGTLRGGYDGMDPEPGVAK